MSRKNKNGGRRHYSPKTYSRDFLRLTPIERAIQEANSAASPKAVAVSDRIACDDKCSYEYKRMPAAWLETDFSYQRKIDSARVDRIVNSFDPRLANEVKVSFRDGKFYVFDGAHTLSALKRIHGEEAFMVDCKVYRAADVMNTEQVINFTIRYRRDVKPGMWVRFQDEKWIISTLGEYSFKRTYLGLKASIAKGVSG